MIWLIAAMGLITGWIFGYASAITYIDECPSQILGYKCKGEHCNHSRYEIKKAKETMRRNYWNGRPRT